MATFYGPGGANPSAHIAALASAAQITVGDALYAGQAMRTRIRQRTAAGIDYTGAPFAQYSDSYRKRKVLILGHADNVDLFGYQQHPHMLNAIVVESGGTHLETGAMAPDSVLSLPTPAPAVALVIRGDAEAMRAKVHNEGATVRTRLKLKDKSSGKSVSKKSTATIPQRRFFDASEDDREFMMFAMDQRRQQRLQIVERNPNAAG